MRLDHAIAAVPGIPRDTGETYYRHWLRALERIVAEKGVTDAATLSRYRDAWDHAAERTSHGMPIVLQPEDFAP